MRNIALLTLVGLVACNADAVDPFAADPGLDLVAATASSPAPSGTTSSSSLPWQPHSPFSPQQLENLCNDPEVDDLPTPPTNGSCKVEVRLTSVTHDGQGPSEGRGEISFDATGDPQNTPPGDTTGESVPEETYSNGQTIGQNVDLGTYRVPVGQTRDVEVCVDFTEHDNGGSNGGDDTASGCTTVTLRCVGADLNADGVPDGQAPGDATIGPLSLCGDNTCNGSVTAKIEILSADADMDNVPNAEDFTPELCDEERKATAGNAAIVYWYYGDDKLTTLFQGAGLSLGSVFANYDYVVLVADNDATNAMNLNGASFRNADITFPPTREGFMAGLRDLTMKGYRADVLALTHGYGNGASDSAWAVIDGESNDDDRISGEWLEEATLPDHIGTARGGVPLMALFGTNCLGARITDSFIEAGLLAGSGAINILFFAAEFGPFVNNWVTGMTYEEAVTAARTFAVVQSTELVIKNQGKLPPYGCVKDDITTPLDPNDGPGVVTDENECAEDFFTDAVGTFTAYNIEAIYDNTLSGAANMAASGTRELDGKLTLRFGAVGSVWP